MPTALNNIKTVVFVMMENRSFDHLLGYLSLPPYNRTNVDGLSLDPAWLAKYANALSGKTYPPFHLGGPNQPLPDDPPHERTDIATQLGAAAPPFPMNGFAASCPTLDPATKNPLVMGYFTDTDLPTTHFFAQSYSICDRWFSAIPTSTQPNRLMAMSGISMIEDNVHVLPEQQLVYDWLQDRGIRWRVYHQGLPFFAMMPSWTPYVLLDFNFRDFSRLINDLREEDDQTFPQVIFIEPRYTDAPHVLPPTDDHAPSPISNGQDFLAQVYGSVVSNTDRWKETVMIVTYDEHGGFFDHVQPLGIKTSAPTGAAYPPFITTGPRVPAFIISPWVEAGAVFNGNLDHTSVLKFLAELFGAGSYSPQVDPRNVASVSAVLTRNTPRPDIPHPPGTAGGFAPDTIPTAEIPKAFAEALARLRTFDPEVTDVKFPTLADHF